MAEPRRIGVALLAAGGSRRFGAQDKLAQSFRGRRLGEHAAAAIPRDHFAEAWVVVPREGHPCEPGWKAAGFEPLVNARADEGMGTSVALAAAAADEAGLDALLIALADMPLVPREHFEALVRADGIATSARGDARMPPAVFPSDHYRALMQLKGDRGARDLLAQGRVIACRAGWLADIDTPDDLAGLE